MLTFILLDIYFLELYTELKDFHVWSKMFLSKDKVFFSQNITVFNIIILQKIMVNIF